jgi:hypothetical protein
MTEKHFSDISGYILTKYNLFYQLRDSQKPQIMWRPNKSKAETERLMFESKPAISVIFSYFF